MNILGLNKQNKIKFIKLNYTIETSYFVKTFAKKYANLKNFNFHKTLKNLIIM